MRVPTLIIASTLAFAAAACERRESRQSEETPAQRPPEEAVPGSERAIEKEQPPRVQPGKPYESDEAAEAGELVNDAADTLREMKSDPKLVPFLKQARAVFIVPHYGRAGAGVGVSGGEGVLVARGDGKWSGPAFYDVGRISVGAQFGAEGGHIAMLLMTEEALRSFKTNDSVSFNAGAELTIVDYSALARASSVGRDAGDVIFWSDTAGAFVGATLGATNIDRDDDEHRAYYGKSAKADDVISGRVMSPQNPLQSQLSDI